MRRPVYPNPFEDRGERPRPREADAVGFDANPAARQLMRTTLGFAVLMWVMALSRRPLGELVGEAHECAQVVGEKGDAIQFRSKTKGRTAEAFNALAKGIAILSFAPGGVQFLGDLYDYEHPDRPKRR